MPTFRFIAFDQDSQMPLAHDSCAVYALQKADRLDEAARVYIIDAGTLGLQIWLNKMTLPDAEHYILENMRERLKVLEVQL